jgi:putative oxidoreductase
MTAKNQFWTNPDIGLLILRITVGGLLILHGVHKISAGLDNQMQLLSENGLPGQLMYFAYFSQILAPVLLAMGTFTRISALAIIITMITIIYVIPVPLLGLDEHGASMIELQLFYLLVPVGLFFTGPGRYRLISTGAKHWLLD